MTIDRRGTRSISELLICSLTFHYLYFIIIYISMTKCRNNVNSTRFTEKFLTKQEYILVFQDIISSKHTKKR